MQAGTCPGSVEIEVEGAGTVSDRVRCVKHGDVHNGGNPKRWRRGGPGREVPSIRCAFQSSVSSTSWPSSADVMALAFCDRHVPTRSRLNPSALSADRQAGRELPGSMLLY